MLRGMCLQRGSPAKGNLLIAVYVVVVVAFPVNRSDFRSFPLQALSCMCYECGGSGPTLFACLHCIYFACKGDHFQAHLSASPDHYLGLELNHGLLYCHQCRDYVYDEQCRELIRQHQSKEARWVHSLSGDLN